MKIILLLISLCASVIYLSVIIPSGTGYQFWGAHGHDGLWHLAVSTLSFNSFPPVSPIFSGTFLVGYNYGSDLLVWLLHFVGIPPVFTYFKLIPILFMSIYLYLLYRLGQLLAPATGKIFLPIYFFVVLFSGSFAWILTLLNTGSFFGSAVLLTNHILHLMSNWPYALSLIPFLIALIYLKSGGKSVLKLSLLTACTVVFKLYGGIILYLMVVVYLLLNQRSFRNKIYSLLLLTLITFITFFLIYRPDLSTNRLIFSPFSLINKITEEPSQLHLSSLTSARYTLESTGLGVRLLAIYGFNSLLFFFFHLGLGFFGLFYLIIGFLKKKLTTFDYSVGSGIISSLLFVTLFIQSGEWWNSIQFIFYTVVLLSIYTAYLVNFITIRSLALGITLLALSSLNIIDLVHSFLFMPPSQTIPASEVSALQKLGQEPPGIVLAENSFNSAYVSAISGQQSYFSSPAQLKVLGVAYQDREQRINAHDCTVLGEIDYLYLQSSHGDLEKFLLCSNLRTKQLFQDEGISYFRIIKTIE